MKVRGLYESEMELISKLLYIFYAEGFGEAVRPTIIEDDNPISAKHQEIIKSGLFDVDKLLGEYLPEQQTIKLYTECIKNISEVLSVNIKDLQDVVLLHEFGHWITHKLPYGEQKEWENYCGNKTNNDVHEGWAQLIAWRVVKDIPILKEVFCKLNERQSAPYKVWKQFENSSIITLLLLRENDCSIATVGHWHLFDDEIKLNQNSSYEEMKEKLRGATLGGELGIF